MFAKKQPDQLREKLSQIERDHKIAKISFESYNLQKVRKEVDNFNFSKNLL